MGLFGRVLLIVGVLGATVAVGSLAAGRPQAAAPVEVATPEARSSSCPKLSQAASLPVWKKGGVAFGDVEGTGYTGRATIRYAKDASTACGFILFVKTRNGSVAARVPERDYGKGSPLPIRRWVQWGYRWPGVGTVRLGGGRSQFVVGRWEGASTHFVSLYGILDGKLALLPFHGGPASGTMLASGGSAVSSTSIRCVRGGPLTILNLSGRYLKGGKRSGMRFSRYTYRLRPDGFRLAQKKTTVGSDKTIYALANQSGMNRSGLRDC